MWVQLADFLPEEVERVARNGKAYSAVSRPKGHNTLRYYRLSLLLGTFRERAQAS